MAEEWVAKCKDCGDEFRYSNTSYQVEAERGLSPPERCKECRQRHAREMRSVGMTHHRVRRRFAGAPAPGRLGKIHHDLPPHRRETLPSSFAKYRFGITYIDILRVYASLGARFSLPQERWAQLVGDQQRSHNSDDASVEDDPFQSKVVEPEPLIFADRQVLVIEGPTGSGKSTLLPYRLLVPPDEIGDPGFFTRRGQIVVTQPRIQPTSDIPRFIAEKLHGSSCGPGSDIGYQYSGNEGKQTDRRNRLVFVTDGTLINWIIQEQLNNFSVIMIDEAHERSLNIDLILGLLKARLPRYPHLKLIIASATINAADFIDYFGGSDKVAHLQFQGVMHPVEEHFATTPLLNYETLLRQRAQQIDEAAAAAVVEKTREVLDRIITQGPEGDILVFLHSESSIDSACEVLRDVIAQDSRLHPTEVFRLYRRVPKHERESALANKAEVIARKIIEHVRKRGAGSILAKVLDRRTAEGVVEVLKSHRSQWTHVEIADQGETAPFERLLRSTQPLGREAIPRIVVVTYETAKEFEQRTAPLPQRISQIVDRRIIISTNVAETSLTIDGVAYVVDSGLIKQKTWEPNTLSAPLVTRLHSQSGCRQRRGRAGRIRPGHAYYVYDKQQFDDFEEHTPPEIRRVPLEAAVLTAKAAGVGDIATFDWFCPTDEMNQEFMRSQKALIGQRILDGDADITEQGLELRSMGLEPEFANLLKNADRFACALEVATLLPLLALQKPLRGQLLIWNDNWDAATRWEVKRRQQGLIGGCRDDLDVVMKAIAAWESFEDDQRTKWAGEYFINHEVLQHVVLPGRDNLLDKLSAATKGDVKRPLNLDLLDRVRLVLAYSLTTRIDSSDQLEIASESICFGQQIKKLLYGIRIPYRAVDGTQIYRVSLVVRLDPSWIQVRDMTAFQFGRYINQVTRGSTGGSLPRSFLWEQLPMLNVPLGAIYECTMLADRTLRIEHQLQPPSPIALNEFGYAAAANIEDDEEALEVVGDERFETDIVADKLEPHMSKGSSSSVRRTTWRGLDQDPGEADVENDADEDFLPGLRLRILCRSMSKDWQAADLYVDGALDLKAVSLAHGITSYFELTPTSTAVICVPSGAPLDDARAFPVLVSAAKGTDYTLIIDPAVQPDAPPRYALIPELFEKLDEGTAAIRWLILGQLPGPVDVSINGEWRGKRPNRYHQQREGGAVFAVFARGGRQRNEQPIAVERRPLAAGSYHTILITASQDRRGLDLTWIDEQAVRPRALDLPQGIIPSWYKEEQTSSSLRGLVVGYDYTSPSHPRVQILPLKNNSDNRFTMFSRPVDSEKTARIMGKRIVQVMPVDLDYFPEHGRYTLIVRDPKTYLEIAVEDRHITFVDRGIKHLIVSLLRQESITLAIDAIDYRSKRVLLSRLPLLEEQLAQKLYSGQTSGQPRMERPVPTPETNDLIDGHFDERWIDGEVAEPNRITVSAVVAAVISDARYAGLVLLIDPETEFQHNVFVEAQRVNQNALREYNTFQAGEKVLAVLSFYGGSRRADPSGLSAAAQQAIRASVPDIDIKLENGKLLARLDRRMRFSEYQELQQGADAKAPVTTILELYRATNRPEVELIDPDLIARIDKHYPAGTLIEGCVVQEVQERWLIVEVEPRVRGNINIRDWSNQEVESLVGSISQGDRVDAVVVNREENGFLRLSHLLAVLTEYRVNERYIGVVLSAPAHGYVLRLLKKETGERGSFPLNGFLPKVERIPFSSDPCPNNLAVGQEVIVRIEVIDVADGRVSIPLSAWRAYETSFHVGMHTKRGNLGSSRLSVQGLDSRIVLPQQAGVEGQITVYSRSKPHHAEVLQQVRRLVSDLRFASGTEPQAFLPDTIRPHRRVRAGGAIDRVPRQSTRSIIRPTQQKPTIGVNLWIAVFGLLGIVIIVLGILFFLGVGR